MKDVCAIIVTYHPDFDLLQTLLQSVSAQCGEVILVDNTPKSMLDGWVADLFPEEKIGVIAFHENRGIAAAHNAGINYARSNGYLDVLILDDDSVPDVDMVEQLLLARKGLLSEGKKVSAVGPRYRDPRSGFSSYFVQFSWFGFKKIRCNSAKNAGKIVPADFLISSGSLISLSVLENVGSMREELFMCHVDTDWHLRAAAAGYQAYGICDATMKHDLGELTKRVWFGKWRSFPIAKPLRCYYLFRNSLFLYRKPYAPLKWVVGDVMRLIFMTGFYLLFVAPRWRYVQMMLRGLCHGLSKNVFGLRYVHGAE